MRSDTSCRCSVQRDLEILWQLIISFAATAASLAAVAAVSTSGLLLRKHMPVTNESAAFACAHTAAY